MHFDSRRPLQEGKSALEQRRYLDAERLLGGLVCDDLQNATAWAHLGVTLSRMGYKKEALACFDRTIILEGEIYLRFGAFQTANAVQWWRYFAISMFVSAVAGFLPAGSVPNPILWITALCPFSVPLWNWCLRRKYSCLSYRYQKTTAMRSEQLLDENHGRRQEYSDTGFLALVCFAVVLLGIFVALASLGREMRYASVLAWVGVPIVLAGILVQKRRRLKSNFSPFEAPVPNPTALQPKS